MSKPKVLLLDIETSPLISYTWGLFDQNVALNQIHSEWFVLSWAAKWLGDDKVLYQDQSKSKDMSDDKQLLKGIWDLLNEADIVLGQNSKRFDVKKLNARFIMNDLPPPSPFRQIDTLVIAKKHFAFTSNKLEWMSGKLCPENKKLKTKKFVGFELWKACLAGNKEAWAEMKAYNMQDVIALESLYIRLQPWDNSTRFDVHNNDEGASCNCGNSKLTRRGFSFTNTGKFQRFQCQSCRAWYTGKKNMLTKEKRASLLK